MFKIVKKWFASDTDDKPTDKTGTSTLASARQPKPPRPRMPGAAVERAADPLPDTSVADWSVGDEERVDDDMDLRLVEDVEDQGPGKNVLANRPLYRVETGTYETLKIVDAADTEGDDEDGMDPYNTGNFDRPTGWDKSFRK